MMEDAEQLVSDELGRVLIRGKRVDADDGLGVCGVDQYNIALALGRDASQYVTDEVALRLDDDHGSPGFDVLTDQAKLHGRLANTGWSDYVQVPQRIPDPDATGRSRPGKVAAPRTRPLDGTAFAGARTRLPSRATGSEPVSPPARPLQTPAPRFQVRGNPPRPSCFGDTPRTRRSNDEAHPRRLCRAERSDDLEMS